MLFEMLVIVAAALAGAIASISGFGIGSILTPLLATQMNTKVAVAAVSVPHLVGTTLRYWRLRKHVDRTLLFSFGITSAVGGLLGALLQNYTSGSALAYVLGGLLVFAGAAGIIGMVDRMRFRGRMAQAAGLASGVLGGLVGNQGGIRSAAMLGSSASKQSFVATATAVALAVDSARMPVYFATQRRELLQVLNLIGLATLGVVLGTVSGTRILSWIPENYFRRTVALIILALGIFVLWRG